MTQDQRYHTIVAELRKARSALNLANLLSQDARFPTKLEHEEVEELCRENLTHLTMIWNNVNV
jgi:hypothetical protein